MKLQLLSLLAFIIFLSACGTIRPVQTTIIDRKNDTIQHLTKKGVHLNTSNHQLTASERKDSIINKTNPLISKYSSMLNVNESQLDNMDLLRFMDDWYGVPYKYGGKTK